MSATLLFHADVIFLAKSDRDVQFALESFEWQGWKSIPPRLRRWYSAGKWWSESFPQDDVYMFECCSKAWTNWYKIVTWMRHPRQYGCCTGLSWWRGTRAWFSGQQFQASPMITSFGCWRSERKRSQKWRKWVSLTGVDLEQEVEVKLLPVILKKILFRWLIWMLLWSYSRHIQLGGDLEVDPEQTLGDYIAHVAWEHLRALESPRLSLRMWLGRRMIGYFACWPVVITSATSQSKWMDRLIFSTCTLYRFALLHFWLLGPYFTLICGARCKRPAQVLIYSSWLKLHLHLFPARRRNRGPPSALQVHREFSYQLFTITSLIHGCVFGRRCNNQSESLLSLPLKSMVQVGDPSHSMFRIMGMWELDFHNNIHNNNMLVYTLQWLLGSFFAFVLLFWNLGAKAVTKKKWVTLKTDHS